MLRKLVTRPDWQIAAAITIALRVIYSAIAAALSFFSHPNPAVIHTNALTDNLPASGTPYYTLLGIWERFDTLWYLRIAAHGYDRPMSVIFYPLYPAAIRLVSTLMPSMLAALVVSTVATFFLFWGLLRLAGSELTEVGKFRTMFLFCAWPTSFVLFAGYAESTTIALILWAVIFGREERWKAATLCGILGGLARPSGVLVCIPLAVMAVRSKRLRSLIVALTPIGLLSYWGYLRWSGRISVVDSYRLYQGMTVAPAWKVLAEVLTLIASNHDIVLAIKLGMVIFITLLALGRQVRIEDKAFALVVILQMLMYTGRPLLGAARYLLLVYPAFLAWGRYVSRWNRIAFGLCAGTVAVLNLAWMIAFMNWLLVL